MRFTRIHLALVAASMGHGMVMADTRDSDVGTIGVQGKATAGGGYMVQEESIKGRSTVTKEALDKQTATGNAVDKLKYTPGLNISSEDATGLSGFRFLHILSPCPTGWKSEPAQGIELIRLAVRAGLFAVYEVFDGRRVTINVESELSDSALESYFELQGRFSAKRVDLARVRAEIRGNWQELRSRARKESSP